MAKFLIIVFGSFTLAAIRFCPYPPLAFDAAFEKLSIIRAPLISKMIKKIIKQINHAHINISHKKGYLFEIRVLRLILAKIELIF